MTAALATPERSQALAQVDDVTTAIAAASSLDELRGLDSKLAAFQEWARRERASLPAQNNIIASRLRCQRKAGGLLAAIEREDGGRPQKNSRQPETSFQVTLRSAGISESTAYRWQAYAYVPEDVFERWVKMLAADGLEITGAGLLQLAQHYSAAWDQGLAKHRAAQARVARQLPVSKYERAQAAAARRAAQQAAAEMPLPDVVAVFLPPGERPEFARQCDALSQLYGTTGVTDTVREAVRRQYETVFGQPDMGAEGPRVAGCGTGTTEGMCALIPE